MVESLLVDTVTGQAAVGVYAVGWRVRRPAIFGDATDWWLVIHWSNIRCSGLLSRSTCTLHTSDLRL